MLVPVPGRVLVAAQLTPIPGRHHRAYDPHDNPTPWNRSQEKLVLRGARTSHRAGTVGVTCWTQIDRSGPPGPDPACPGLAARRAEPPSVSPGGAKLAALFRRSPTLSVRCSAEAQPHRPLPPSRRPRVGPAGEKQLPASAGRPWTPPAAARGPSLKRPFPAGLLCPGLVASASPASRDLWPLLVRTRPRVRWLARVLSARRRARGVCVFVCVSGSVCAPRIDRHNV